tara:strand:- start:609 stop:1262 length:654 start_codon:yes stop_codon:yes gene_type:complete
MKNNLFLLISGTLIILSTFLSYFYYETILDFFVFSEKFQNNIYLLYLIFIFFYFLTPMPTTLIILLNGFLFKENGFFISYFILIITSVIIFSFSNRINTLLLSNKNITFFKRRLKLLNYSKSNLAIFLSRFLIPFFFHNIYYGLTKIKLSKFIFIILFAEIPFTYALNLIGNSLNSFNSGIEFSIKEIFLNSDFYIPFIIIFVLFLICSKFKNKINL